MTTRAEALASLRKTFTEAGLDNPSLDARLLLQAALEVDPAELIARPHEPLTATETAQLVALTSRRLTREPVSRILSEREFWGLPFWLSPETLVPRPDTETVVETALRLLPDRSAPLRLLDLGTGSGCLLVALLHELPNALGIGVDRAVGALITARRNAHRNGVADRAGFAASDWAAALRGRFDLVVSNPPYIASAVVGTLDPEVREYDPAAALDGGQDGLDAYRAILDGAKDFLAPQGLLVVEIGYDQAEALRALSGAYGLDVLTMTPDLSGVPRCVALKRT